jgi:hypothetical protein
MQCRAEQPSPLQSSEVQPIKETSSDGLVLFAVVFAVSMMAQCSIESCLGAEEGQANKQHRAVQQRSAR